MSVALAVVSSITNPSVPGLNTAAGSLEANRFCGIFTKVDGPVHCISCNTTFSSQENLHKHLPCSSSSFDLTRVKTEIEDTEQKNLTAVDSLQNNVQVNVTSKVLNNVNIKTEVKSEPCGASEATDQCTPCNNLTYRTFSVVDQRNGNASECNSIGISINGSRRGRRRRVRTQRDNETLIKTKNIAPKTTSMSAPGFQAVSGLCVGSSHIRRSVLPHIAPKLTTNDSKSSEVTGLKIDSVYYTQSATNSMNVVKVNNIPHGTSGFSLDSGTILCSSGTSSKNATVAVPSTFALNTIAGAEGMPSLASRNISTLPYAPFMLGCNILQNTQDPLILRGSTSLVNPLPIVNTVQRPGLVPGFQTINLSQPLTNIQNLNIPLNQNSALGVHQSMPQIFSAGAQDSAVFPSNTNQTVGSSKVSPPQQMPFKVPVLVGNQIVLMNMPVQYLTGVSLPNTSTTMNLSSLIHSPNSFSSAMTVATATQQSAVGTVSSPRPSNSNSTLNIHSLPVLTTAQSTIAPQHPNRQPVIDNVIHTSKTCESTATMKSPPPLLLAVRTDSQAHFKMSPIDFRNKIISENSFLDGTTVSTSSVSSTEQNVDNETTITQAENLNHIPIVKNICYLHGKELSIKSESTIDDNSDLQCQHNKTFRFQHAVSSSKLATFTEDPAPLITTSSVHQPIMSTCVNSGTIISAGIPMLNPTGINVHNIVPQSSANSVIHQPSILLSHFQTNDNIQHGPIPVFNNNTVNIMNNPALYFQNTLSMPRLNFPLQKKSEENVWVQNNMDNQPVVIGCSNNELQIFLNNSAIEPLDSSLIFSTTSSLPTVPQVTSLSKHKTVKTSAVPKSRSTRKLLKKKKMSIKMLTPDTYPSCQNVAYQRLEVNVPDSSMGTVSLGFAASQRENKTVKEMLKTKDGTNSTNSTTSLSPAQYSVGNQDSKKQQQYRRIRPCDRGLEAKSENVTISKFSSGSSSSVKLLPKDFNSKTGLLKKQTAPQCDSNFTNVSINENSQSNDDFICKITDVKSIADLDSQNLNNESCANGTLFVGPLTKEQLDKIIQNPSELEKYVSVPSGLVLSSKALVVPSVSLNLRTPAVSQSHMVSHETVAYQPVSSHADLSHPELGFIKIQPKTIVHAVESPSHSATTSTSNSAAVTSFPQTSTSMNYTISSNAQKMPVYNLITESVMSLKEIEHDMRDIQREQVQEPTSETSVSCSGRRKQIKFLSERRKQELKCHTNEDSSKSAIMKLSFVGDLTLLKDALRRSTVPLPMLDIGSETVTVNCNSSKTKCMQKTDKLNCIQDDTKSKLGKRKLQNLRLPTVWMRNKEKKLCKPAKKWWVPVEVVGDVAVQGKLVESELVNADKSDSGEGQRRSSRISAKPRLDYADLEKLPFKDLDEEIGESEVDPDSDSDFDSDSSAQSQRTLSPPQLSPAFEPVRKAGSIINSRSIHSSSEIVDMDSDDANIPVLISQGTHDSDSVSISQSTIDSDGVSISQDTTSSDCVSVSQGTTDNYCVSPVNNPIDYYYSSESESDMFDSCVQSLSKTDKKKMMWKQHSDITMFLVKHADKFHSDDEKNHHYCNICHKYKTNGIFRLSHHLKKHLSGSLKCSQCVFEACQKHSLTEHERICHSL